ncbi:MAG: hypothetical protein J5I93_28635 [Pirellulaceae bacterium]|nr:hypothetical protein [Pirellulaceae bacterium]
MLPYGSSSLQATSPRKARRSATRRRLRLEPLEDRRLLATFTVMNTADSGAGSLRQAVLDANGAGGADTIDFAPALSGQTISLTGPRIQITGDLTINGPGADQLTVDGLGNDIVFDVAASGITVNVNGLHVTRGVTGGSEGGAIDASDSGVVLNVSNSLFTNNEGSNGGAIRVLNIDALSISNSTFTGNSTNSQGGAIHVCCIATDVLVVNSTISGNTAGGSGGGIFSNAPTTVVNSTIVNNVADFGGGGASNSQGSFTLHNTIVSGNTLTGGAPSDLGVSFANTPFDLSSSHNVIGDAGSSGGLTHGVNGNQVGVSPLLGPLQSNGGPTPTHDLLPGSLAIDAGSDAQAMLVGLTTDQRGLPRFQGAAVDVGAVESGTPPETTINVVGNDLVIVDVAPKNDDLTISFDSGTGELVITDPGRVIGTTVGTGNLTDTVRVPLASFTGNIIVNTFGGDDALTVDLANNLGRALYYDGGPAGSDSLSLTGGTFASGLHTLLSADSGQIQAGSNFISYTGLEPVDDNNAYTDLVFDFLGGVESITLTDSGGADGRMTIDSTLSESVTFNNPSNSLTIQTFNGGGSDAVSVNGIDSAFLGSLTVDADGNDTVDLVANYTFAANRHVVADAEWILVWGDVATSGTGMIDLQATRSVGITAGGSLASAGGPIRLYGNRTGGPLPGDFVGVDVAGSVSSTGGNIDIQGRGGNFAGGFQHGVRVSPGASVTGGGPGTLTHLDGIGGASAGGVNFGVLLTGAGAMVTSTGGAVELDGVGGGVGALGTHYGVAVEGGAVVSSGGTGLVDVTGTGGSGSGGGANGGVRVHNAGSRITSSGGNVQVTGFGASGSNGVGVEAANGGEISAGGMGTVLVQGTGAAGTSNSNAGVFVGGSNARITSSGGTVTVIGQGGGIGSSGINYGVQVWTGGAISAGAGGHVIVQGTGGGQTGNGNSGVVVYDTGAIQTVSGNVVLTGQGGGTGGAGGNYGAIVAAGGTVVAGGTGTVQVLGTGGLGSATFPNHGVEVNVSSSSIQSNAGNIWITGVAGAGAGSVDLNMSGSGFISAGGSADVIVNANSIAITSTNSIAAVADDVNLLPRTAGTSVDLGGADAPGTLGLTDSELDRVFADVLRIGDAATGPIQVSAPVSPANVNTLSLTTGAAVSDSNPGGVDLTVPNLAIAAVSGIGASDPLETSVSQLAVLNASSGDVQLDNSAGGSLAITTVDALVGIVNLGADHVRLTADDLDVLQPISATTGNIELFSSHATRTIGLGSAGPVKGSGFDGTSAAFALTDAELDLITTSGQRRVIGFGGSEQFNVHYGGTDTQPLFVLGAAGEDQFFVAPAATMPINLDGGTPSAPALPGDTLHLDMSGAVPVVIVDTIGGYAISASTATINFVEMETLDLCDDSGEIDNADIGDLYVRTTGDNERITFTSWNDTGVKLRIDNMTAGTSTTYPQHFGLVGGLQSLSQLLVYAQGGDDLVSVAAHVVDAGLNPIPVEFHGEEGNDYLTGANADDILVGGPGNDRVLGGEGNNQLFGDGNLFDMSGQLIEAMTDGDDYLAGRGGADRLWGGGANDRLIGGDGDDVVNGGSGDDLLDGGLGTDVLRGEDGNDTLSGGFGHDLLLGGAGNDQLFGRQDNDLLIGGAGADYLRGDAGNDLLIAGTTDQDNATDAALLALLAAWSSGGNDSTSGHAADADSDTLLGDTGVDTFWADILPLPAFDMVVLEPGELVQDEL